MHLKSVRHISAKEEEAERRRRKEEGGKGHGRCVTVPCSPNGHHDKIENTQQQPGGRREEEKEEGEEDRGRPVAVNWGVYPGRKKPAFLHTLGKPRRDEERTGTTTAKRTVRSWLNK